MAGLRALAFVAVFGLAGPAAAADAYSSDWAASLKSSARLIAGDPADGRLHAGVEIRLAPGAITYWRDPGDAGAPPVLSFDGSQNFAQAHTLFPEPLRIDESDGGEAFGYDGSVILPIDVEPLDPAKPVTLALKLDYAVCEKICVPAKADLELSLAPGAAPSPYEDALAHARARTPRRLAWTSLAGKVELAQAGGEAWRLCLSAPQGQSHDLFVEAPESWWFAVKRESAPPAGKTCFHVKLEQKPADARLPVTARLTVTGGPAPFETSVALGGPPAD